MKTLKEREDLDLLQLTMEALADKICKEELKQEPSDENLAFRKTLVHGMVRWDEESKVENLSSNPVLTVSCRFCDAKFTDGYGLEAHVNFNHNQFSGNYR